MSLERWHGTAGGYSNHGCRCEPCTRANTERIAEYRRVHGRNHTRVIRSGNIPPETSGPGDAQTSPTLADTYDEVTT